MSTYNSIRRGLLAVAMLSVLGLSGCENGNLFGGINDIGDSGDIATINSEAAEALDNRDYGRALALYNQVLNAAPNNSEALYGASAAAVGATGINIATLITNITNQINASGVNDLSSLIKESRESIHNSAVVDPASILDGIDIEAVDEIIDLAICRLRKIVSNSADGTIQPNDIDVLLNLGSLCLVRGVLRPLRSDILDVTNVNGNFEISYSTSVNLSALCASPSSANANIIARIGLDVVGTYALFNRAVEVLNLTGNPIIVQLRTDVNDVITQLLTPTNSNYIGDSCRDFLANEIGITLGGFSSSVAVFRNPGTCS